ncbi:serine hydrolase domain-containing protein [Sinomonas sp. ASV486]|uniref:serine hydrolase domain-containing protein n=1 Tax=Sinomonas sp. ASV486 TaxID=3051170 RepID=UPI0027DB8BAE|nr:serine hydrolase domain-containing protein [Sinomonas sp. ASV486]MDQ4491307.1 serine hydrolase domain-containing protein [Sinomonas sp. ASV486]
MDRGWLYGAAAGALVLALSGCAAPQQASTSNPSASSGTAPSSASAAAACVADPQAVIRRTLPAAASGPMPAATAAALDKAAQDGLAQASTAGAIVAIRSPQGTWIKAFGLADQTTRAPMTVDMYQRIGSVTKTFTGTVVLRLVQDGRVSLNDPISRYVPGVPRGDEVTLRLLLNMTSGVPSYSLDTTFQHDLFTTPNKVWTPDQLIALGLALPRQFEPGAKFDYSNTNTLLLGKVMEKVTGTTYTDALQNYVIAPLKLSGTSMPGASGALPSPHATGLTLQGLPDGQTTPQDATAWNPTWAWSAGELTSSAADLLVYGRAMATGQGLLDEKTQTERLASIPGPAGYGLAVGCIDGWLGHTGEIPGFNTSLFYDTRSDTTVTVLANSDIPSGGCTESATLPDTPKQLSCMDPASRIFVSVSAALGHEFKPNPKA